MNRLKRLRKIGFSKLTPLEIALKQLFSNVVLLSTEEIESTESLNRILASDIISEIDIPPYERSAMDGYAICAEDSFGASPNNPKTVNLIGKIEIGQSSDLILKKGEAIRISTGAAIPKEANAVIKIEDTELENELVTLYAAVVPGKNVSRKGEDMLKGTVVLTNGTQLKSKHIALLCSLGIKKLKVRMKPKVSVFATGDELVEVGNILEGNKIFNSNTPMISNLVKTYGGAVVNESTLEDNKEQIKENLKKASQDSDIVVFTGGTSVGTRDYLPEVMQEEAKVLTHGIAMRPGSPLLIGMFNKSLVFCLPGTPVAAYICFLKVVGPTIRKMMGCSSIDPRIEINATISKDVPVSGMGYISYLRVKLEKEENNFIANPVKLKGSGIISSLTQSDGIVEIPSHKEGLKKGEKVIIKLFP